MMNHIKILLVYKSIIECKIHQLLLNEYGNIICDYETHLEKVSNIDFITYDIVIYDVELLIEPTFIQEHRHPIFIAKHHQPTEAIIHKFIEIGFDMFIIPPLDNENIEYMLLVYSLINKYKERPDEEDGEETDIE
jgi:hypothetical protein